MVKRFKKFQSGEGARYITRKGALRKLQLSLRDFRTLCIIKGIYPREPKHRRRAQRGKSGIQTLYLKKDIQFLLHEPIVWKIRELKVHLKRIKRAKSIKDYSMVKRYSRTIPVINVDHIIRERYPTFIDALRDLDDCLTLCALFATMPRIKLVPPHLIALSRRLTVEFMHAIIVARALRYVFVSIKGIYFQVEIKNQTITWIIPHSFSYDPDSSKEVDFATMTTFAEFYTTMLGFVNFRLYHNLNLYYPPKLRGYSMEDLESELIDDMISFSDRIAALNIPLQQSGSIEDEDNVDIDKFPTTENEETANKAHEEFENIRNLKKLFEGFKVFLNREVPREPLVFALRCFGAQVSWDEKLFPALDLFPEDDETITHQIVDRPSVEKQYISRYYVQPQWVFDSINARRLLPVEKYFVGVTLPPHLSPFSQEFRTQRYVPPEERSLKDPSFIPKKDRINEEELSDEELDTFTDYKERLDEERKDDDGDTSGFSDSKLSENEEDNEEEGYSEINSSDDEGENTDNDDDDDDGKYDEKRKFAKIKLEQMKVASGTTFKINKNKLRKEMHQDHLLKEKMIRKKYRNLYKSMKQARIGREREIKLLKYKRRLHDRKSLEERKALLRAKRTCAALG